MLDPDEWQLQILVPDKPPNTTEKDFGGLIGSHEIEVPAREIRELWGQTMVGLLSLAEDWTARESGGWQVSEVKIGLTLSAKGQLLFIAEAGAAASVEVKISRAGMPVPDD